MLPDVKTILYASDIEEGSRPAFRAAVSMAGHYDASITFLHVIEPLSATARNILKTMMNDADLNEMHDSSVENLKNKLLARIQRFCETELDANEAMKEGQIIPRVEEGVADRKILKVANEIGADLIVMGTRTHSSVGQFLLGSTANRIMHHTQIPVLIIPLK